MNPLRPHALSHVILGRFWYLDESLAIIFACGEFTFATFHPFWRRSSAAGTEIGSVGVDNCRGFHIYVLLVALGNARATR